MSNNGTRYFKQPLFTVDSTSLHVVLAAVHMFTATLITDYSSVAIERRIATAL